MSSVKERALLAARREYLGLEREQMGSQLRSRGREVFAEIHAAFVDVFRSGSGTDTQLSTKDKIDVPAVAAETIAQHEALSVQVKAETAVRAVHKALALVTEIKQALVTNDNTCTAALQLDAEARLTSALTTTRVALANMCDEFAAVVMSLETLHFDNLSVFSRHRAIQQN